jgi:hypothetical protein
MIIYMIVLIFIIIMFIIMFINIMIIISKRDWLDQIRASTKGEIIISGECARAELANVQELSWQVILWRAELIVIWTAVLASDLES